MPHRFHVVIIGGGFSGTALAIHLVRRGRRPLRVTLIEARERLGRGIAYSTNVDEHVLNTRPGAMSLFSDSPGLFESWLGDCRMHSPDPQFVPRSAYGDYIEDTLIETVTGNREPQVVFQAHARTRAVAVSRRSGRFDVALDDGMNLRADAVVLATGNPEPADPLAPWRVLDSLRYLPNGWDQHRVEDIWPTDRILILGTGLTMIDVVLSLQQQAHIGAVQAMSRRGLIPRAHEDVPSELPAAVRDSLRAALVTGDLRAMVRVVRRCVRQVDEHGVGWQAVFDGLRPIAPELWRALSEQERARFLRHVRPFWEVHRHRLAPGTARKIAALQRAGKLSVSAGHVCRAFATEKAIFVDREIGGRIRHDRFDWIINCTSPSFRMNESALHGQLIADGLLTPDRFGLGYVTAGNGAAIGANGRVEGLYLLGPACKARCWEQTAVPELREQAERLAAEILAVQGRRQRPLLGRLSTSFSS